MERDDSGNLQLGTSIVGHDYRVSSQRSFNAVQSEMGVVFGQHLKRFDDRTIFLSVRLVGIACTT